MKNVIGSLIGSFLILITFILIQGCVSDTVGIDYYKAGEKVELEGLDLPCYGLIEAYIPISKYRVKIICHPYISAQQKSYVISEFLIIRRL